MAAPAYQDRAVRQDTAAEDRLSVTLTRRIAAPPARVYAAWTEPAHLMRWFGSDGGPTLLAETDLRVGGRFHLRFRKLDDGIERDVSGVYRTLEPPRRLSFSWIWSGQPAHESLVTIELRPEGEATHLTLTHAQLPDDAATRASHHDGWTGALNKLCALFA